MASPGHGSFRRRLVLSFVTLAMLVVGGSGWFLYERALESLEAQLSSRLVDSATLIANSLPEILIFPPGEERLWSIALQGYYEQYNSRLRMSVGVLGNGRIYVFDREHKSILDTERGIRYGSLYHVLKHRDQTEFEAIWRGQASHTKRITDPETGVVFMTGYAPVFNSQGQVIAGVGVEMGSGFEDAIHGFKRSIYFFAVLSALLTLILGLGMARQVTSPIKRLVTAAREIGRGNLDQAVDTSASDEIGYLSVRMEEMRQKLLTRERQLRQMLAGVAHEIRNPLGGIEIYAGLIADDLPEGDERKQHILKVIGEVRTLNAVIAEFLEFARPVPSVPAVTPVSDLIEDAVFLLNPEMERARVAYYSQVSAGLSVYADGEQIKRALINLMKNAIQAMEKGGRLSVSARNVKGKVEIEVADTGPGVAQEARERLFEPFFTTREQGSGLGLAIVQQTLEKNRGRVELESAPGEGTTVTMYLPTSGEVVDMVSATESGQSS